MPRILTYNVHRCVGTDKVLDVARTADVIARFEPDIVALQELDVGRARTGHVDQAHEIARRLDMAFHFHPAMKVEEELYGDAILSRYPETLVQAAPLPLYNPAGDILEPRGALWLEIEIDGVKVQVINTHLGFIPVEQQRQSAALAGPDWLAHPRCKDPVILLGDFNATTASVVYRDLTTRLRDARKVASEPVRATSTFPSGLPILKIDHVFVSEGISIRAVSAPRIEATRVASDHLPLIVDFDLTR